jgi:hypothetical protein
LATQVIIFKNNNLLLKIIQGVAGSEIEVFWGRFETILRLVSVMLVYSFVNVVT